jgi:hypothetical protein
MRDTLLFATIVAAVVGAYFLLSPDHDAATGDTIERIQDATDNPDGCPWADRLRNACD